MNFKQLALTTALAATFALPSAAMANAKAATPQQAAAYSLMMKIKADYPDTNVTEVNPSAVSGLYEVVMGKNIAYTDSQGKVFIFGNMFDMKTQTNLTAARAEELNKVDLKLLDKSKAIKTVKGNGKAELYVFSDPDCPFCKRLEQTLRDVTDVTIYTFIYPLEQLHPEAVKTGESIWCARNRNKAWDDYMLREVKPSPASCKNPIQDNIKLAQSLGIGGTPTLINGKGHIRPGALPLGQLTEFIK